MSYRLCITDAGNGERVYWANFQSFEIVVRAEDAEKGVIHIRTSPEKSVPPWPDCPICKDRELEATENRERV